MEENPWFARSKIQKHSYPTSAVNIHLESMNAPILYGFTALVFVAAFPALYFVRRITLGNSLITLFSLDIALTLEAATYSDVVFIALLHVVMIPVFFGMIYFDLIKQNKREFTCFLCGREISKDQPSEIIRRNLNSSPSNIRVHSECVKQGKDQKKPISERMFRKGIPK